MKDLLKEEEVDLGKIYLKSHHVIDHVLRTGNPVAFNLVDGQFRAFNASSEVEVPGPVMEKIRSLVAVEEIPMKEDSPSAIDWRECRFLKTFCRDQEMGFACGGPKQTLVFARTNRSAEVVLNRILNPSKHKDKKKVTRKKASPSSSSVLNFVAA